jgi:hypothetical protein
MEVKSENKRKGKMERKRNKGRKKERLKGNSLNKKLDE